MAMLVLAMSGMVMASPSPWAPEGTLAYVDHWLSSAEVGETITVSVKAQEVTDLFLSDFEMTVDAAILEVVDDPATSDIEGIEVDDQANSFETIYTEMLWLEVTPARTWMKIKVASGRPLGVKEGLSGTVGLAKITFIVKGRAALGTVEGTLKLFFTDLIDIDGMHLSHNVQDGVFTNDYPILWLKKKGAHGVGVWTEWRSAPMSEGLTNTLYAKIANTGNLGAMARVQFTITDPTGFKETISSDTAYILARGSATVSTTYDVPAGGKYTVTGIIEFDIVPFRPISWGDVIDILGGHAESYDNGNAFKVK